MSTSNVEASRKAAVTAAQFSLIAPFVGAVVYIIIRKNLVNSSCVAGAIFSAMVFAGFACGIFALVRTRSVGREGIFSRAIVGCLLSGIFSLICYGIVRR